MVGLTLRWLSNKYFGVLATMCVDGNEWLFNKSNPFHLICVYEEVISDPLIELNFVFEASFFYR